MNRIYRPGDRIQIMEFTLAEELGASTEGRAHSIPLAPGMMGAVIEDRGGEQIDVWVALATQPRKPLRVARDCINLIQEAYGL